MIDLFIGNINEVSMITKHFYNLLHKMSAKLIGIYFLIWIFKQNFATALASSVIMSC